MSNRLWISMDSRKIPVYSPNAGSIYTAANRKQIGYLNYRETFVYNATDGNAVLTIYFLDGSGNFTKGLIWEGDGSNYKMDDYLDHALGKIQIDGNWYKTYQMRKEMPVYNSQGYRWGSVAANHLIATSTSICGASHPDWFYVNYVHGTDGKWHRAGSTADGYGFVDSGIAKNSMYNGIALISKLERE